MLAVEDIRGDRSKRRRRVDRLLDELGNARLVVERDDAVLLRELTRQHVTYRNRARAPLFAPEAHVLREAELEQVVAGDHEQVVVETGCVDHELHVADGAETVVVRDGAVIEDRYVAAACPLAKHRRLTRVRHYVDVLDRVDGGDGVHDPVDDRPPADRKQLLCPRVGQRT